MEEKKKIDLDRKTGRTVIGGRRPPDYVVHKHVDMTHQMLVEGWSIHQIMKHFEESEGTPLKTVENWITTARKYQAKLFERDREYRIIQRMSELKFIYQKGVQKKDYKLALDANKEMRILCGDNGPMKIQVDAMPDVPTRIVMKVDGNVK